MAGASAASGTSLLGTGLTAGASLVKGIGGYEADKFQSQELARQAQFGEVKAAQTGDQLSEALDNQLGNIAATRAAMHDDPTSPTGAAISSWQETLGERQKNIAVTSLQEQAQEDQMASQYEQSAAGMALLGGIMGGAGSLATGVSKVPGLFG